METDAIRNRLIDEEFTVNEHRFPYTYHHDYVRRSSMSRSDVAGKLREVAATDIEYALSACYGAILYLISEQPEKVNCDVCDLLEHIRTDSVYNIDGTCGINQMREIINIK